MRNTKRIGIVAALLAVGVLLGAGIAQAVVTSRVGTVSERQVFVTQNTAVLYTSTAYVTVGGSAVSVVVPAGTRRHVDARFTAESLCSGSAGYCSVRVVFRNSAGGVGELHPAQGTDFAFDSTGDMWEGHAIERSTTLGAGTYLVYVQAARVAPATGLRLDDWHFAVETVRP